MAKQKKNTAASVSEKTLMEKIGNQASHIKEEIIAGKDHLVEFAGDAISSVKESLHNLTSNKKSAKKPAKKIASKVAKRAVAKRKKPVVSATKAAMPKAPVKMVKKSISKK